jgi:RND family efflux transporter MFP subunit
MTSFKRFATRRTAIAAAIAVAFGAGVAKFSSSEAEPAPAAPAASISVSVLNPAPARFDRAFAATGSIRARDELVVGSDNSGLRLTEVLVDVGSLVRRGELLARADDDQLKAQVAQQRAQVKQAEGQLALARANARRAVELREAGVYSDETYELRQTDAVVAEATHELAVARLRELEIMAARTRIVAPADGVVSSRTATVGAVIQPGAELFRLIKDGSLEWLAELPSQSLGQVGAGAAARVVLDDGRTLDATVRLVEPTMNSNTRNGLVHVALPHGTGAIAGSHARGRILLGSVEALAVPESSVFTRDGYAFVYAVMADGIARRAKVEVGARQGGLVEVSAGIDAQTRVIGTGAGFVKDGEVVQIVPADAQRVAQAGESS